MFIHTASFSRSLSLSPSISVSVSAIAFVADQQKMNKFYTDSIPTEVLSQFVVTSLANETYFQWKIKHQLVEFHELSSFNLHKVQMAGEKEKKRIQEILK